MPVFTTRFAATIARIGADLHVHRGERNQNDSQVNVLTLGGWHRSPPCRRHSVVVKVHAFTMTICPSGWEETDLPNSV